MYILWTSQACELQRSFNLRLVCTVHTFKMVSYPITFYYVTCMISRHLATCHTKLYTYVYTEVEALVTITNDVLELGMSLFCFFLTYFSSSNSFFLAYYAQYFAQSLAILYSNSAIMHMYT